MTFWEGAASGHLLRALPPNPAPHQYSALSGSTSFRSASPWQRRRSESLCASCESLAAHPSDPTMPDEASTASSASSATSTQKVSKGRDAMRGRCYELPTSTTVPLH